MKVRWTEGSIRFRITPSELERLQRDEPVCIRLGLPGGDWQAVIEPVADGPTRLDGDGRGGMHLTLGRADRERLATPELEGVYFQTETENGPVRFFIEKDFPCVHPRPKEAPEHSETFAPPPGFAERHRTVCP